MKTAIELAREAGNSDLFDAMQVAFLERLVAFARADEREACAQVCKKIAEGDSSDPNNEVAEYTIYGIAMECADAIRVRGNT